MIDFSNVKKASYSLSLASKEQKNEALINISKALIENAQEIVKENEKDLALARQNGLKESMIARLTLKKEQIEGIASDILKVVELDDPVGEVVEDFISRDGLRIKKIRVPMGVIGVIYEARPNVTVDVSVLCIKTGNACVLKGGKEAVNTNKILVEIIKRAIAPIISEDAVMLLEGRDEADELLNAKGFVDLIIPRGSKNLINHVVSNSKVPVIETGAGVCHTYVEKSADFSVALKIIDNAKTSKPSVCNALETVIIDREIADNFCPLLQELAISKKVKIHADSDALKYIDGEFIDESGYSIEYNALEMSVKIVDGIDGALEHIRAHSTKHSECIISTDKAKINKFLSSVDSACVYSNASTRFSDGGCFGMGAEIGISTQKLHARGPMGLKEITSYKYVIEGNGEIR
ncbi:MAG: glutamate-5-semialdehyde dehydrogenase [Clostridia bacterium]|nr:glutamate-5-semialdehyde dehydrogenase [Clostridia bacterium]